MSWPQLSYVAVDVSLSLCIVEIPSWDAGCSICACAREEQAGFEEKKIIVEELALRVNDDRYTLKINCVFSDSISSLIAC